MQPTYTTNWNKTLGKIIPSNDVGQLQSFPAPLNTEQFIKSGFPPKVYDIESKLVKFREEKWRQEIAAKEESVRDEERRKAFLMELRDKEMANLKRQHEYIEKQKHVSLHNFKENQLRKAERLNKTQDLESELTRRLRYKFLNTKEEDFKNAELSMADFYMNCQRQGIDLKRGSEKPKMEKTVFVPEVVLAKFKEKKIQHEATLKQKVKRKNKLFAAQKTAAILHEEKQKLENFVNRTTAQSRAMQKICQEKEKENFKKEFLSAFEQKKAEETLQLRQEQYMEKLNIREQETRESEAQRRKEYKKRKLEYREDNLAIKIGKRLKHKFNMKEIIEDFIEMTEIAFKDQISNGNLQVNEVVWKELLSKFVNGEEMVEAEKGHKIFENITGGTLSVFKSTVGGSGHEPDLVDYVGWEGEWKSEVNVCSSLGNLLFSLVDQVYPKEVAPPKPAYPWHLSLRILLTGPPLSGRHSQARFLAKTFGLIVIDPYEILKEAIAYAFPIEDTKAKKKDTKKPVAEEVEEDKDLKELGLKGKEEEESFSLDLLLECISFKLKREFPILSAEERLIELREAHSKFQESIEIAKLKIEEEEKAIAMKPKKKASKNVEEPPKRQIKLPEFFYVKGFILVNFPTTAESLYRFEKCFGGYIEPKELLNAAGEKIKRDIGLFTKPIQNEKIEEKIKSAFTHVIFFEANEEVLLARNKGRVLDPVTGVEYNREEGQVPEIKNLQSLEKPEDQVLPLIKSFEESKNEAIQFCYKFSVAHTLEAFGIKNEISLNLNMKIEEFLRELHLKFEEELTLNESPEAQEGKTPEWPILSKKSNAELILKRLNEVRKSYFHDIKAYFIKTQDHHETFVVRTKEIQKNFVEIIERPDSRSVYKFD